MSENRCDYCKKWKLWAEFSTYSASRFGQFCLECSQLILKTRQTNRMLAQRSADDATVRDRWLRKAYGIDSVEYAALLAGQGGGCAICDYKPNQDEDEVLCVDHCHDSKRVRGILCKKCNMALGSFGDNLDGLRDGFKRVISYLEAAQKR